MMRGCMRDRKGRTFAHDRLAVARGRAAGSHCGPGARGAERLSKHRLARAGPCAGPGMLGGFRRVIWVQ